MQGQNEANNKHTYTPRCIHTSAAQDGDQDMADAMAAFGLPANFIDGRKAKKNRSIFFC
jgi:hypothetical protein